MRKSMVGGMVIGGILGATAVASAMASMPKVRAPMVRALRCQGRKIMRKAGQWGIM